MPPMKLFFSPTSPFARTVRVVARERGLSEQVDEFEVDPFSDPTALILANPLGRVPTLICDDGASLYDSRLICVFLDGHPAASGPMLIPALGRSQSTSVGRRRNGSCRRIDVGEAQA